MFLQREAVTLEILEEMIPLLRMHYVEIAHYKDIKFDPDFDRYLQLEANGVLRLYTARCDETGLLLGYAAFFVNANIHYKASIQAVQDVIYVNPEHRGTGGKLIQFCDEQLKLEGVEAVYHHVKDAHNFGPMLERMGYGLVDLIYAKRLN